MAFLFATVVSPLGVSSLRTLAAAFRPVNQGNAGIFSLQLVSQALGCPSGELMVHL